ncbi:MAG: guanylate kinase [Pseudomonadota bacterium]
MNIGDLYIVSAPSGAGKTSLLKEVRSFLPQLKVAVSHTTRNIRPGEVNGEHYYFVNKNEFLSMVEKDDFVEHAEVFGHYYGTSKQSIQTLLEAGHSVVLEIDWQGAQQVRSIYPEATSIFIFPPSIVELEMRLRSRGQDSEQVIADRMCEAQSELSHYDEYQYLVINDDMSSAVKQLINVFSQPDQFEPPSPLQMEALLSSLD